MKRIPVRLLGRNGVSHRTSAVPVDYQIQLVVRLLLSSHCREPGCTVILRSDLLRRQETPMTSSHRTPRTRTKRHTLSVSWYDQVALALACSY